MINPAIPKTPPWKRIWFFILRPFAWCNIKEWVGYNKVMTLREAFIIIEQELNHEYEGPIADLEQAIGLCLDLNINEEIPLAVRLYMDAYRLYD